MIWGWFWVWGLELEGWANYGLIVAWDMRLGLLGRGEVDVREKWSVGRWLGMGDCEVYSISSSSLSRGIFSL